MAGALITKSTIEKIARRPTVLAALAMMTFVLVFYLYGRWAITDYYLHAIPHYDSVGLYLKYFNILDVIRDRGVIAAFPFAFGDALSPLQSVFTIVFSPVLEKSMSSFHLYNTLCLIPALFGMYAAARAYKCTTGIALLFTYTILIPGGLYYWDLGVFDLRRDAGMYFLLTGALFFLLAYFGGTIDAQRSRLAVGICAGLSAGLCLLSRDSAFGFLFGVALLPAAAIWIANFWRKSAKSNFLDLIAPVASFVPFILIWGFFVDSILGRILNPYLYYGANNPAAQTLSENMLLPFFLLTDQFHSYYWLKSEHQTLIIMTAFAAVVLAVMVFGRRRDTFAYIANRSGAKSSRFEIVSLLATLIFIMIYVQWFLAFIVGWQPLSSSGIIITSAPYYPALIAFLVLGLLCLRFAPKLIRMRGQIAATICGFAIIAVGMHTRSQTRKPVYGDWFVETHEKIGALLNGGDRAMVVAAMAEDVRIPAVQLYAVQRGAIEPERLFFDFDGLRHDFNVSGPADETENGAFEAAMESAILCKADFIVTSTNLDLYRRTESPIYLHSNGADLVQRIATKLENAPQTILGEGPSQPYFRVTDNRERNACNASEG